MQWHVGNILDYALLISYLCNTVFKSIKKYYIELRKSMIEYH